MSAPTMPSRPGPVGPDTYLTGPYTPVTDEGDVADLQVEGELPADLDGAYLRNGPNPRFSPIGSYLFPLDGDGMLHRVEVSGGRARYSNRFVRTPMVRKEEEVGHALWGGLTTPWRPGADEVGAELAGSMRELPDINVVRHGGRLLALAECKQPYRIGPQLETLEKDSFDGQVPAGICAHPKIDPTDRGDVDLRLHRDASPLEEVPYPGLCARVSAAVEVAQYPLLRLGTLAHQRDHIGVGEDALIDR